MKPQVTLDRRARRYANGQVLIGGSPRRLIRLSALGAGRVSDWLDGEPIGMHLADATLARRLLTAGILHPVPRTANYSLADVTLVIPVLDNTSGLTRLNTATRYLRHRIIVDDGSHDPIPGATDRHQRARGPAAARNTGWQRATTELIAFLDSDTVPDPDWLDAIIPLFDDPAVAAVAPRVRTQPTGPLGGYESDRGSLDMGPDPADVRPDGRVRYVPSAALVVRRDAWIISGGFDETLRFGEDVDLVWRLVDAGKTVRYQPNSIVWHEPRATVRGWLRQRFDYGSSAAALAVRHPGHLACAYLSPTDAAGWALAATGHRRAGLLVTVHPVLSTVRRLSLRGVPRSAAAAIAIEGQLGVAGQLAAALRRTWWPAALFSGRGRLLLAAAVIPLMVDAVGRKRGLRWIAFRLADDVAYTAGVWAGCLRYYTAAPLMPRISRPSPPR